MSIEGGEFLRLALDDDGNGRLSSVKCFMLRALAFVSDRFLPMGIGMRKSCGLVAVWTCWTICTAGKWQCKLLFPTILAAVPVQRGPPCLPEFSSTTN